MWLYFGPRDTRGEMPHIDRGAGPIDADLAAAIAYARRLRPPMKRFVFELRRELGWSSLSRQAVYRWERGAVLRGLGPAVRHLIRRLALALVPAVAAMALPLGEATAQPPAQPLPHEPLTASFVAAHEGELKEFESRLERAVGHVWLTDERTLAYDRSLAPEFQAQLDTLNAHIRSFELQQQRHGATALRLGALKAEAWCLYIDRWMVELIGWTYIAEGAVVSAVGLFADFTIFGIPAGAILGVIGIGVGFSGGFILWYADTYFQPGWYCS